MTLKSVPHPVDLHVGARLRQRRKVLGLGQARLAQAIGLTFQQVQKYERGTNRVSASMLYALSCVLKVAPGWFFEGLPATDGDNPPTPAELSTARAVRTLVSTPDGVGLALLMAGLRPLQQRQVLALMEALAEPDAEAA
ncbi:helix-turn-helix domain-containing protein [Caulobacter hibisci]|uniref:Helix-turn-helix transcriptional regulator n=1 Tax=Caulobacter hibisci TaxID=2035993 RepID=A0ABS0T597_9CAUL|nr:helix-turn-helix transcriptional regulator [Caulobacter hibisci]MBI1687050.1 helix-turn-helix transcriptional regulator [Caulobacter hibisci]